MKINPRPHKIAYIMKQYSSPNIFPIDKKLTDTKKLVNQFGHIATILFIIIRILDYKDTRVKNIEYV